MLDNCLHCGSKEGQCLDPATCPNQIAGVESTILQMDVAEFVKAFPGINLHESGQPPEDFAGTAYDTLLGTL
jgi:hypothetical protein